MSTSKTKRLNINLSEASYNDLQKLARENNTTMTELVKTSFGLLELAYKEKKQDHIMAVADQYGKVLKEIVVK